MSDLERAQEEIFEWCKKRPYAKNLGLLLPYSDIFDKKTKIRFLFELFIQHKNGGINGISTLTKNNKLTYCRWFLEHVGTILIKNRVYYIRLSTYDEDINVYYDFSLQKWHVDINV